MQRTFIDTYTTGRDVAVEQQAQAHAAVVSEAVSRIWAGEKVSELPPALVAQLGGEDIIKLVKMENEADSAQEAWLKRESWGDYMRYSNPEQLAKMSREQVIALAPQLGRARTEQLAAKWESVSKSADGGRKRTTDFAADVDWGQALDVTVEVLEDPAGEELATIDKYQRKLEFLVQNSLQQDQKIIGKKDLSTNDFADPVVFGTQRSVSFSNVEDNAIWFGGRHYVQVSFSDIDKEVSAAAEQQPLKYRLTFTPVGQAVSGPRFDSDAVTTAAPAAQQQPQAQEESKTGMSMVWWMVIAAALVLIVVVFLVINRLLKRAATTKKL